LIESFPFQQKIFISPFFIRFHLARLKRELKREATAAFDIHRVGLNLAFVGDASFDTGLRMDRLFLVAFKMATKKKFKSFLLITHSL
jgi:hypothetical protein